MNWYKINSQVGVNGETDIFIFDEVGRFGVSADKLINEVQRLKPRRINLHINSPGGSISDGIAIYTYLRAHSAPVSVYISARAASIAGVIAMAGDEVVMTDESVFHMHQAAVAGYIHDNADGLQDTVDALRKMDSIIKNVYRKRTGASDELIDEWMTGDTYFTAQEALDAGLIDRIEDKVRMVACEGKWDPERYPNLKFLARHSDEPSTQNESDDTMSKTLEDKIASLTTDLATAKADKNTAEEALATEKADRQKAIDEAVNTAKTETLDAQSERIDSIVALSEKYGKDGDLDALAMKAIKEGKSAGDFKDEVLDAVAERPTSQRLENGKPDGGKGDDAKAITTAEYLAKSHAERRAFKAEGGVVKDD